MQQTAQIQLTRRCGIKRRGSLIAINFIYSRSPLSSNKNYHNCQWTFPLYSLKLSGLGTRCLTFLRNLFEPLLIFFSTTNITCKIFCLLTWDPWKFQTNFQTRDISSLKAPVKANWARFNRQWRKRPKLINLKKRGNGYDNDMFKWFNQIGNKSLIFYLF